MNQLRDGIERTTRAFLEGTNARRGPEIQELSIVHARAELVRAQAVVVGKLPADIEDQITPEGPYGSISLRIVRPKGNSEMLPVVIYFHGGGWVLGDKNTHDRLVRDIANGANAAVVF